DRRPDPGDPTGPAGPAGPFGIPPVRVQSVGRGPALRLLLRRAPAARATAPEYNAPSRSDIASATKGRPLGNDPDSPRRAACDNRADDESASIARHARSATPTVQWATRAC